MYYNLKIFSNDSEFTLSSEDRSIIEREMDLYFCAFFEASNSFCSDIKKIEINNPNIKSISEINEKSDIQSSNNNISETSETTNTEYSTEVPEITQKNVDEIENNIENLIHKIEIDNAIKKNDTKQEIIGTVEKNDDTEAIEKTETISTDITSETTNDVDSAVATQKENVNIAEENIQTEDIKEEKIDSKKSDRIASIAADIEIQEDNELAEIISDAQNLLNSLDISNENEIENITELNVNLEIKAEKNTEEYQFSNKVDQEKLEVVNTDTQQNITKEENKTVTENINTVDSGLHNDSKDIDDETDASINEDTMTIDVGFLENDKYKITDNGVSFDKEEIQKDCQTKVDSIFENNTDTAFFEENNEGKNNGAEDIQIDLPEKNNKKEDNQVENIEEINNENKVEKTENPTETEQSNEEKGHTESNSDVHDFSDFLNNFKHEKLIDDFLICSYYIKNMINTPSFTMKDINAKMFKATGKIAGMSVLDELISDEYIALIEDGDIKKYSITDKGENYFIENYQG